VEAADHQFVLEEEALALAGFLWCQAVGVVIRLDAPGAGLKDRGPLFTVALDLLEVERVGIADAVVNE
jgi:hypothetical protein